MEETKKGNLYLCPTPIGNLGDMTLRGIEILETMDLIAAEDTRHTLQLLNHLHIKKPMVSYFEHNKRERGEEILAGLLEGKNVALVTDAGTPAISDPGEDLVKLCIDRDVTVVPLPGANACITALIASGMDTGRFTFQGFLSVNKRGRKEHLNGVKNYAETLIFYEAPHKLKRTLKDMLEVFGNRRICLGRELTKKFEEFRRCSLEEAVAYYENETPKGEFVLIVEGNSQPEGEKATEIPIEDIYASLLEKGVDSREAVKLAAQEKGISKREAYDILKK